MADGPETQTPKPESMLFNGRQCVVEAFRVNSDRTGRISCTFTTKLRLHSVERRRVLVGKHVTFSAKPLHLPNPDSGFQSAPETAQDRKRAAPTALWEM